MKNTDLDSYLNEVIRLQKELWYKADTGIGAACLLIPSSGETIYGACTDVGHNHFAHAEHKVIDDYIKKHGKAPPAEAILITTISPCSNPNSSWRVGDSCSTQIERHGIKKVYTGVIVDKGTTPRTFDITLTQNPNLARACEKLHGLFNIKARKLQDGSYARLVDSYKNAKAFNSVFK